MNKMPIGEVRIPPNRQRTTTDEKKLNDLKASIIEEGLFHAIIIDENNNLVAGHTRLQAITSLAEANKGYMYASEEIPAGFVPYTITHKTDEYSLFKIELEENLRREQLSPIDEATALARLHELRKSGAPEILPGTGIKAEVTFKDTAKEALAIKGNKEPSIAEVQAESTRVSDAILVDTWKDHPDVKKAKNFNEAARAAKKAAEREFRGLLGQIKTEATIASPHRVINKPCQVALEELPGNLVDVIIADPPYGVGANKFGDQSWGHEYEDDPDAFWGVLKALHGHAGRITKPDAAMFIFMDVLNWFRVTDESSADWFSEWYIWPTPLIWYKTNKGHAPQPKRGPARRYECILYALKGQREVRRTGMDVLPFAVPDVREHGAQKPVDLYVELLNWVAYPGDTILDPTAGSGTIIQAANRLDLAAIAIEQDSGFASLCREKIEEGVK